MKSFIIPVFVLSVAATPVFSSDKDTQNPPAKPAAAPEAKGRPSAGTRPTANVRTGVQSAPLSNARRNSPSAAVPFQRGSVAVNPTRPSRSYQPRPTRQQPVAGQSIAMNNRPGNRPSGYVGNSTNNHNNSYGDALRRYRHERHDRNWWRHHCQTIVFVRTGYYYLDAGYWYPAYGYDPAYDYYDYDGPIYTYGNLLPDQVITNVQLALRDTGYYLGPITGSLGPATRAALANFQRDYGLAVTGAIDEPTVLTLGLV